MRTDIYERFMNKTEDFSFFRRKLFSFPVFSQGSFVRSFSSISNPWLKLLTGTKIEIFGIVIKMNEIFDCVSASFFLFVQKERRDFFVKLSRKQISILVTIS